MEYFLMDEIVIFRPKKKVEILAVVRDIDIVSTIQYQIELCENLLLYSV